MIMESNSIDTGSETTGDTTTIGGKQYGAGAVSTRVGQGGLIARTLLGGKSGCWYCGGGRREMSKPKKREQSVQSRKAKTGGDSIFHERDAFSAKKTGGKEDPVVGP